MSHSHSQMMALPIIPSSISAHLANIILIKQGKCFIYEIHREDLLIDSSTNFLLLLHFLLGYGLFLGTTLLTSMNWMLKSYHSIICKA
ncbi:hypothetical protein AAZV13_16G127000 [Glycine max]